MPPLPSGKVTFLLTDIEGSTNLVQLLEDRYVDVVGVHRRLLRRAFQDWGGKEIDTAGDGFFIAFDEAGDAVKAAVVAQRAISAHAWPEGAPVRVRIGMHTGQGVPAFGGYIGLDVHRAARIMAAGHGGETLLSQATQSSVEGALPEDVTLRDLGEHRLKDLSRPERIFQVITPDLPSDFPPLRTLNIVSNNLPIQLTSFIGREREMTDVRRLLATTRLLTLQGVGGVGKTRLAIQVAASLIEEFSHGVWLVDLAPLSDPALAVQAVASTLGVREMAGRGLMDMLLDTVRSKRLLLVLDNCEHLASACAHLAESLLRSCPSLQIVATSREPLAISGELTYRVPTLSFPDLRQSESLERLGEFEAVHLFADRAAFAMPNLSLTRDNAQVVAEICRRLDGIPLAIELAAARVRGMSVQQIAARLDDRFRLLTGGGRTALPKHQTLLATMDWSYDLLSQAERVLLWRLSVFAGGWTLEAAEQICSSEDLDRGDVLNLLSRLVERSLVIAEARNSAVRYRLLETVRQYAHEKLLKSGEEESVRERHRDWHLELAEQADSKLQSGADLATWLDQLELEHDNLREALAWSLDGGGTGEGVRLAGALGRFWSIRGYWNEGRTWLEKAVSWTGDSLHPAYIKVLHRAGALALRQQDFGRAVLLGEHSLALCRKIGDKQGIAASLNGLGILASDQGDYERAAVLFEESLAIDRELGDKGAMANRLNNLGTVARDRGNFSQAIQYFEEGLALSRELRNARSIPNLRSMATLLRNLGDVSTFQGDFRRAQVFCEESLALFREVGDKEGIAYCSIVLAKIMRYKGEYDQSVILLQESLALCRQLGDRAGVASSLNRLGEISLDQADYGRAAVLLDQSLSLFSELHDKGGIAHVLDNLGLLARSQGNNDHAGELFQRSLAISEELGVKNGIGMSLAHMSDVALRQGDTKRAATLYMESLAIRKELGDRRGISECISGLAIVAQSSGQYKRAAQLLGAAEALRESNEIALPPHERAKHEHNITSLRSRAGEAEAADAWSQGRMMTWEKAVEYALSGDT